jgi:hypothetical protein
MESMTAAAMANMTRSVGEVISLVLLMPRPRNDNVDVTVSPGWGATFQ